MLVEERDYFRREAMKLDDYCKENEKVIKELKMDNKLMKEDHRFFENIILETKKENKTLKSDLLEKITKNSTFFKNNDASHVKKNTDFILPNISMSKDEQFITQPHIETKREQSEKVKDMNRKIEELTEKIKLLTAENNFLKEVYLFKPLFIPFF